MKFIYMESFRSRRHKVKRQTQKKDRKYSHNKTHEEDAMRCSQAVSKKRPQPQKTTVSFIYSLEQSTATKNDLKKPKLDSQFNGKPVKKNISDLVKNF